jgi:hypothetical protein
MKHKFALIVGFDEGYGLKRIKPRRGNAEALRR